MWNNTHSTRFHRGSFRVNYGKNSCHFKIFTPTPLVALATNIRYAFHSKSSITTGKEILRCDPQWPVFIQTLLHIPGLKALSTNFWQISKMNGSKATYQDEHDALGPERGPAEEESRHNNNWIWISASRYACEIWDMNKMPNSEALNLPKIREVWIKSLLVGLYY